MTQVLKPGFLVSLKTSLQGGVVYHRKDLDVDRANVDPNAAVSRWETERVIDDPEEHARATKVRSAAGTLIRGACTATAFGLLCPEAREGDLDQAIRDAQALVDAHNETAHSTVVRIYVLRGRIASTDEEAVRGISSEIREVLEQMQTGIRRVDVEAIREAANKARKLGAVLGEEQEKRVSAAVRAAREAAKYIFKRIDDDGAEAVRAVAEAMSSPIEAARFAFLEIEESVPPQGAPTATVAPRDLDVQ